MKSFREKFIGRLWLLSVTMTCSVSLADKRPNILWITCEDSSPRLGCYGDTLATTPHLDRVAAEGVRFTRAHHVHAVCAPARTGVITGMYPSSLGCNHMRCKGRLPQHVKPFPYYLKQAGYYCTNNVKTDYNFVWNEAEVWHENSVRAHWRNRPDASQPFFAVFNITLSHESQVWPENHARVVRNLPEELLHDPARVKLPAYYPDTPAVRACLARQYDVMAAMDAQVGRILKQLANDGLADDTVVFFWSDHGDGLPRAKRWLYDSGTRVPMILRIPERFRTSEYGGPGTQDERLTSMLDLAPTVLALAGVEAPPHLHGRPLWGGAPSPPRRYLYAARDRIDERHDMVRMVRDDRYLYLRSYMPWFPAFQTLEYAERNAIRQEMRRLLAAGQLAPAAAQYFATPRPYEQLFDTAGDPDQVHNIAAEPQHAGTLERLRNECDRWMLDVRDAQLVPEPLLEQADARLGNRWAAVAGAEGEDRLRRLLQVAGAAAGDPTRAGPLIDYLSDDDPAVRWWAAMGLANGAALAAAAEGPLRAALADESSAVRVAAARALDRAGHTESALPVLLAALNDETASTRLWAITVLDELDARARPALAAIQAAAKNSSDEYIVRVAKAALQDM